MECGYRTDIVVERSVIIDTKSIDAIGPMEVAQLLTYLQFLQLRKALILNFKVLHLKDGIKRVIRGY